MTVRARGGGCAVATMPWLHEELEVSPEVAALARRAVREAVRKLGGDASLSYAVQLMVTEVVRGLVAAGTPSRLVLEGRAERAALRVTVTAFDSDAVEDLFTADYVADLLAAMTDDVLLEVDRDHRTVRARLTFALGAIPIR